MVSVQFFILFMHNSNSSIGLRKWVSNTIIFFAVQHLIWKFIIFVCWISCNCSIAITSQLIHFHCYSAIILYIVAFCYVFIPVENFRIHLFILDKIKTFTMMKKFGFKPEKRKNAYRFLKKLILLTLLVFGFLILTFFISFI